MRDTKFCVDCSIEKPLKEFPKCFAGTGNQGPRYAERYPERCRKNRCKKCYARRYFNKLKLDFYRAMGEQCECCGEKDIRFLSLHHRNNDGNKHRETLQCNQIYMLARRQGYPRDVYALFCFNCNCGTSAAGGICPHKSDESLREVILRMENITVPFKNKANSASFKSGHDDRRTKGQFKEGFDGRRPNEQVVQ